MKQYTTQPINPDITEIVNSHPIKLAYKWYAFCNQKFLSFKKKAKINTQLGKM